MEYTVRVPYQGYCRGQFVHKVEAESEQEAIENADYSNFVEDDVTRDDRDFNHDDATVEEDDS